MNFKTHRQSYKIKKAIENPPKQWKIFRNTHEAIVDEETFERVQELRRDKHKLARTGKINDSRFQKLSADYEKDQAELTEKIQLWEQEIAKQDEEADSIEQLIRRAKK